MKNITIIIVLCLFNISAYAQDVIYKIDGNEIKAKIVEIEAASIKYRNFDQLEGPIRNIPISQVFMIKYQDGTVEKYTNIANLKTEPAIDTTEKPRTAIAKEIDIQIERAKSIKKTGINLFICGITSSLAGGLIYFFSSEAHSEVAKQNMKNASYVFFGVSVPLLISGGIISLYGKSKMNALEKKKAELSFQITPFDNVKSGKITSTQAVTVGIRILF